MALFPRIGTILSILCLVILAGCDRKTVVRRAAFEIGAEKTSVQVADVDVTHNAIEQVLYTQTLNVPYQYELELSNQNSLSSEIIQRGTSVLMLLKATADEYHPSEYVGIARNIFHTPVNSQAVLTSLSNASGIPIRLISTEEEGLLAFTSALALANVPPQTGVVLDTDGGGFHVVTLDERGQIVDYSSSIGTTVLFKHLLAAKQAAYPSSLLNTPNPIGPALAEQTADWIIAQIGAPPQTLLQKIKDPKTITYAMGNAFRALGMVGSQGVTLQTVQEQLTSAAPSDDTALRYTSQVIDLILLSAVMKAFQMPVLYTLQTNSTTGLLLTPSYWVQKQ